MSYVTKLIWILSFQAEHQKLVQGTSALSARCDQLIRELDSAKKMLAGMDEENAQLNDQLKVICRLIQKMFTISIF